MIAESEVAAWKQWIKANTSTLSDMRKIRREIKAGKRAPGCIGDDRKVKEVPVMMLENLFTAETQADYDRTGIYQLIGPMARGRCPGLTPGDLARFIESHVKPIAKARAKYRQSRKGAVSQFYEGAENQKFCGLKISVLYVRSDEDYPNRSRETRGAAISIQSSLDGWIEW